MPLLTLLETRPEVAAALLAVANKPALQPPIELPVRIKKAIRTSHKAHGRDFASLEELFAALDPETRGGFEAVIETLVADASVSSTLPGVPAPAATRLAAVGIESASDLERAAKSPADRKLLEKATGIPSESIELWRDRSTLTALTGDEALARKLIERGYAKPDAIAAAGVAVIREVLADTDLDTAAIANLVSRATPEPTPLPDLETPIVEPHPALGTWTELEEVEIAKPKPRDEQPADIETRLFETSPELGAIVSQPWRESFAITFASPRDPDVGVRPPAVLHPSSVALVDLPERARWWCNIAGCAETDREPPAEPPEPVPEPPVVPVDGLDLAEREILEWAWRELFRWWAPEREVLEREIERKRKKLRRWRRHTQRNRDRRRRDRRIRDRERRQRERDERRRQLNERWRDLDAERNRVDGERRALEHDRDRLARDERDIRNGPPPDPNCRSAECRSVRAEREATTRRLVENMHEGQRLDRDGQRLTGDERQWSEDSRQLEDLLDRGYGMDAEELSERRAEVRARELSRAVDELRARLDEIDALEAERDLSPREIAERTRLAEQIDRGERARQAALAEQARLANQHLAYDDPDATDGLELRALDRLGDGELEQLDGELSNALDALDAASRWLENSNVPSPPLDQARRAYEKAMADYQAFATEANGYDLAVNALEQHADELRQRRARIRAELRQLGSTHHATTIHGTPDEVARIESLRAEYRTLEEVEAQQAAERRSLELRRQVLHDNMSRMAPELTTLTPGQVAASTWDRIAQLDRVFGPFLVDGQIDRRQVERVLREPLRDLVQWEAVDGVARRIDAVLRDGSSPDPESLGRRLGELRRERDAIENRLRQAGFARRDDAFVADADNFGANVLAEAIGHHAERVRQEHAQPAGQRPRALDEARPASARDRRIDSLRRVDALLERIGDAGERLGLGAFGRRIVASRREHVQAEHDRLTAARREELLGPADRFLRERLEVTDPTHPIARVMAGLVVAIGPDRMRALLDRFGGSGTITEVELLRHLFVDELMRAAIDEGRYLEAVRHLDRYTHALTELLASLPDEHANSQIARRLEDALRAARRSLADNYRALAQRHARVGEDSAVVVYRSLATMFDDLVLRAQQETYFLPNTVETLLRSTDAAVDEALALGDLAAAIDLIESRLAQANILLDEAARQDNVWPEFSHSLAREVERLADLYRGAGRGREAAEAELLAATHWANGAYVRNALARLQRVDTDEHAGLADWKQQLVLRLFTSLPAPHPHARSPLDDLRLPILDELARASATPSAHAYALALSAHELLRQHRNEDALAAARSAWELDPLGPVSSSTYLQLLLELAPTDLATIVAVMRTIPSEDAARIDAVVMSRLIGSEPSLARLEAIELALAAGGLDPARVASAQAIVTSLLARAYAREPGHVPQAQAAISRALRFIHDSSWSDERKRKATEELTNLLSTTSRFEFLRSQFAAGVLPGGSLCELFSIALATGQREIALRSLRAYAASEAVAPATRLVTLAAIIESLAKQRDQVGLAPDRKAFLEEWIGHVRDAGQGIGDSELAALELEIAPLFAELRAAEAELAGAQPNWLESSLGKISIGGWVLLDDPKLEVTAAEDRLGKLKTRHDTLGDRALAIEEARMRLAIAGRTTEASAQLVFQQLEHLTLRVRELRANGLAAAETQTDATPREDSATALARHLAQIELTYRRAEAVRWIQLEIGPRLLDGDFGRRQHSTSRAELERLSWELHGETTPARFSDNEGARRRFLNQSSYRELYTFRNRENEFLWKLELRRAEARQLDESMLRLVRSGPMYSDDDGKLLGFVARKALEVELLLAEQDRLTLREHLHERMPMSPLLGRDYEARRNALIQYQLRFEPGYRAIFELSRDPSEASVSDYHAALATAYSRIQLEQALELLAYTEEPWYSRGVIKNMRLALAPFLDDPDSMGFGGDLARFEQYQEEVRHVTDGLWILSRTERGRALALSDRQREALIKHGFIVRNADGSEDIVEPWNAAVLHRDLDLPTPWLIDEVLNPLAIAKLFVATVVPGMISGWVSRYFAVAELFDGMFGAFLFRASINSVLFTWLSYPIQLATSPAGAEPSFIGAHLENFAMFLTMEAFGELAALFPEGTKLFGTDQIVRLMLYRGVGYGARLGAEAALFSGLQALTGEELSSRTFLHNLLTIGVLHATGAATLRGIASGRALLDMLRRPDQPVAPRPTVDARTAAAIAARHANARRLLRDSPGYENLVAGSADIDAIRAAVREAGATLFEVAQLPEGERARTSSLAHGTIAITIDANSTRGDLFNELVKLRRLQEYGIDGRTGISARDLALIEFESYAAEAVYYRDKPMTARKANVLALRDLWWRRLRAIETGRMPNRPAALPNQGFGMGFGREPLFEPMWFELTMRELELPRDTFSNARLARLNDQARRYVDRRCNEALNELQRLKDLQQNQILKLEEQIHALRESFDPNAPAEIARLEAELEPLLARLRPMEDTALLAMQRAANVALGLRDLQKPDIHATEHAAPIHRQSWQRSELSEGLRAWFDATIKDRAGRYVELSNTNRGLRADLAAATSAAQRNALRAQIKTNQAEMVRISAELGGEAALESLRQHFGGEQVDVVFMERAGGGGAGELDLVVRVGNRLLVIECKGGSSEPATAVGLWDLRLEQGSLAYILETAIEMWFRGENLIRQGHTQRGERLCNGANAVIDAYYAGTIESYIARTPWRHDAANVPFLGETTIHRVELGWDRDGGLPMHRGPRLPIVYPAGEAAATRMRAAISRLRADKAVRVESDGSHAVVLDSPRDALQFVDAAGRSFARPELVVLPAGTIKLKRTGAQPVLAELGADPGLQMLRDAAERTGRSVLAGVELELAMEAPRKLAVLFHPNGTHATAEAGGTLQVPTMEGDVQVKVVFYADGTTPPRDTSICVVFARCEPARLHRFLERFPRGIGVNWSGPGLEAEPAIYFEDVPRELDVS